jgi:hypothetical protein
VIDLLHLLAHRLVNELGDGCWEAVAERLNARFSGGIRPGPSSSSYPPGDCLLLGEIYSQQQQQRRTSSSKGPGERSPAECKERWSLHVTPAGRKEVGAWAGACCAFCDGSHAPPVR